MLITLMKDHIVGEKRILAGEQIEVSPEEYNWLMKVYLLERQKEVELERGAKATLDKIKEMTNDAKTN